MLELHSDVEPANKRLDYDDDRQALSQFHAALRGMSAELNGTKRNVALSKSNMVLDVADDDGLWVGLASLFFFVAVYMLYKLKTGTAVGVSHKTASEKRRIAVHARGAAVYG